MRILDLIYALLPRPVARNRATDNARQATRLLVLTDGHNPTFTYYLEERLARSPFDVHVRDLTERLGDVDPDGLHVIVCRYIRPRQLLWLYRNRRRFAGASLFIDDDLAATVTAPRGSRVYKAYLMAMGIAPLPVLNRVLTDIWVSTPALSAALAGGGVSTNIVLPPFPPAEAFTPLASSRKDDGRLVMAFHATGSHDAEHAFLIPIVREILQRCREVHFEVVAEGTPARLWVSSGLPPERFTLYPKQEWGTYLVETARRHVDILLVPLLHSRMNDVRSNTKRFDSARMGAAAVFSRCAAYDRAADADEILIDNDAQSWIKTICRLAEDGDLRRRSREATMNAVRTHLANTDVSFPATLLNPETRS